MPEHIFQPTFIILAIRTGFEPVLLAITLFTNHPYIGPSTIPPPDYVVGPAPYTELVLRSIKRLRKRPTLVRSLAL